MKLFLITFKQDNGISKTVSSEGRNSVHAAISVCLKYGIAGASVTLIQPA